MARNTFEVDELLEKDSEFQLSHLIRLGKYIRPYQKSFFITVALMLVSSVLGLAPPYLLKIAIDTQIPNKDIGGIVLLSVIMLVCLIISVVILRFRVLFMSKVGQSIIRDLRYDIFEHLQELPFTYYDSRPHGKILVRVVNYVNSLSDMLSNGIINLVTDLFSLVVIVIIMLLMDVRLTLISMAGLPFLLVATWFIKNKQRVAWRLQSAKQSNMNAYLHETLSGMKVTQSFVREDLNQSILHRVGTSARVAWMKAVRIMFLMSPTAENVSNVTLAFLYVCGAIWLSSDVKNITVGMLVAFVGYISRFWGPINNIANFYNTVVVNMTYMERIYETIDEPVLVKDMPNAKEMPPIQGKVTFDHVTFSYDPGFPILKDVSFTCNPGDTVALVGPTGAGKTTVVNLISRFYDTDAGTVSIDGVDIHGVTLRSLRTQMGIMLQDSFIFSGTILDNIRYARMDATDEEVMTAAKAVCAHEFIMAMEDGYHTEVNERGTRLSVGERQLISFARALLANPRILILDEATSSIDTKTELALQEGLNKLLKGRTSFLIAHRLSTIKNATTIMYVDQGKILEAGNHASLMAQQGAYYHLYQAQYAFLKEDDATSRSIS